MILQRPLACIFATLSLLMASPHPEQHATDAVRLFNKFSDSSCEMIDLYLDSYLEAVLEEPSTEAHIITYGGRFDSPGKLLRYVRHIKGYLADSLEKDYRHVSVIDGGQRDKLSIELWIVCKGGSPPIPTDFTHEIERPNGVPYRFDESSVSILKYERKFYLQYGLLCTLPDPEWDGFFRILRDEPILRGHIIIYVGHNDKPGYASMIEQYLRAALAEDHAQEVEQLTMAVGGEREWSQIEIWLVPRDGPNPKATPRPKSARVDTGE